MRGFLDLQVTKTLNYTEKWDGTGGRKQPNSRMEGNFPSDPAVFPLGLLGGGKAVAEKKQLLKKVCTVHLDSGQLSLRGGSERFPASSATTFEPLKI